MAKDPAFLFYPNDWLGGTMGMSFEEKGAYLELLLMQFNRGHMTEHMIRHTIGHLWDKIKDKFSLDDGGLYYNKRLKTEHENRKRYSESRRNNKNGNNQYTKKTGHMTSHMENEDVNRNENKDYSFGKTENLLAKGDFLAPKMLEIFKRSYPDYPEDENIDFGQLLQIGYKIGRSKGWLKESVTNGNMQEVLRLWGLIVEFSKTDNWFSSRSISDFNKEYQRLIQKMKHESTSSTSAKANGYYGKGAGQSVYADRLAKGLSDLNTSGG